MLLSILLVVGFLIAVTALYVAAELGIVAVRRGQVRERAEAGHWLAARLWPVVNQPAELDRAIAACQIGITVSSLVLGAYGQATLGPLVAPIFRELGWSASTADHASVVTILISLTVLHMILGELLPKSFALEFPSQTAMATIVPLGWSMRLFSPLLYLFNGSGLLMLRLLGIKATRHRHVHSPGEIDLLLTETTTDGELDAGDRLRLRRALRLETRRARDLMVPRGQIVGIDVTQPVEQILAVVAEAPFTRFPVHRGTLDQLVGVLHTKDVLLRQMDQGGSPPTAIADLVRPIVSVPAAAGADKVLVVLRERRSQLAMVVNERGAVVGLITLEDVLSEVFGALTDELKGAVAGTVRRKRGP